MTVQISWLPRPGDRRLRRPEGPRSQAEGEDHDLPHQPGVYVFDDLDGYWAYLEFPAHVREELWGIPHLEKFAAIDVSDSDDPELGEKIAALQARHQQEHPEIAAEIAQAVSFTVPDGAGQPAD